MKGLAIIMMVVVADCFSMTVPAANNAPEPVVVETPAPTEAPTEAPTTQIPTPPAQEGFQAYSIYGRIPPVEWQRYLYDELASRGKAWYMPYAVCQIQQESCWNQYSDNGRDIGLTQQKGIYWADRAAYWGVPGASIWDPYAQLHVYACMMCSYLDASGGDVGWALSAYYLGAWDYSDVYVNNVMEHWGALEVVR
ncbi:MAG: hypothetical protein IJJ80_04905 [Clostridia bacterium]|nr:hypothetical protein [Clostridia bacterium]